MEKLLSTSTETMGAYWKQAISPGFNSQSAREKFSPDKALPIEHDVYTPVLGYTLLHFHWQFERGFSRILFSSARCYTCAKHVTCTIFGYSALKEAVGVVVSKHLLNSKKLYWQGKILNYNKNLKSNTNNVTAYRKSVKKCSKLPKNCQKMTYP